MINIKCTECGFLIAKAETFNCDRTYCMKCWDTEIQNAALDIIFTEEERKNAVSSSNTGR